MNWTSKQNQKHWDKAYKDYALESGLSIQQVSDFIKINPYVYIWIENRAKELSK